MAISDELLQEAVRAVTRVEGLAMDENDLVEDVFLLAYAFPEEEDFKAAVASTCKAMAFLIGGGSREVGGFEVRVRRLALQPLPSSRRARRASPLPYHVQRVGRRD